MKVICRDAGAFLTDGFLKALVEETALGDPRRQSLVVDRHVAYDIPSSTILTP